MLLLVACGGVDGSDGSATASPTTDLATESTTAESTADGDPPGTTTTGDTTSLPTTGAELPPPAATIEEALDSIPGLNWIERPSKVEGYRSFVLSYRQPIDHDQPDGPNFFQDITLMHRHQDAPMVLSTEGYALDKGDQRLAEPASLLHANYLEVEHRFFGGSLSHQSDWSPLTIEQAAADHHRITVALKQAFYRAPWLSTGISKGGMTATYFRRFYPDDVVGTVAYVAPLSHGIADPRYWPFIEGRVPPCTQKLVALAREVLLRRDTMLSYVENEAWKAGYDYTLVTADQALELSAINLPFSFWQYQKADQCDGLPTPAADDGKVWQFLQRVGPPNFYRDEYLTTYEPYYWQAARQLGAPGTDESAFADLLLYPGLDLPTTFIWPDKTPEFDPEAMQDLAAWMDSEATAMLFIYGENDPWTAGAYAADPGHDVHRFIAPGGNHLSTIADLSEADRARVYERLEAWAGATPLVRPLPVPLPVRAPL